jgi:hypothetical protein
MMALCYECTFADLQCGYTIGLVAEVPVPVVAFRGKTGNPVSSPDA